MRGFSVTFGAGAALVLAGLPLEPCQGHAFDGKAAVGEKEREMEEEGEAGEGEAEEGVEGEGEEGWEDEDGE